MAKKRPVTNLMALGVLSTVVVRDLHPYDMARALRGWGKDQDLPIKWGSLYTVVRNLARHGLLEEAASGREGRRPERTVYRITPAGRAELVDWTRELLSAVEHETPRFRAGLSVMAVLTPDEVTTLLQQRVAEVSAAITAAEEQLAAYVTEVPRLFLIEIEYDIAMLRAESTWMRSLIGELADGTLPGIEQWRQFHETGRPSDDMVELAEKSLEK
ncbi:PadR family transcriptional regulator [Actinoplanes sp. NPDC051411]|uniref:PadR family transcriptional regulator n=1 Tax=Actinoplanes sp. NPDC051411 TaxID=3155522 RepID=UPI003434D3E8